MKRFATRRLITILCATGMLGLTTHAMAAGFQLFEQDGASIGNDHAGYAAEANDASIAWYNPAGMSRIKNQQVVFGADPILSDFNYKGSVSLTELTPTLLSLAPPNVGLAPVTVNFPRVSDQGGVFSVVPFFHYVAPINDRWAFGFSIVSPFGLKTSFGSDTPVRYAATYTSVMVIDLSPSLSFKITPQASIGAGFDAQRMYGEFDNVGGALSRIPTRPIPFIGPPILLPDADTTSTNKANDWAYGYHLGFLYEFTPCTRVGVSYHSKVKHHLTGSSTFEGPIAGGFEGIATDVSSELRSGHATADVTLPAYTTLSWFNKINPQWSVMASVMWIQWNVFDTLVFNNAAGAVNIPTIPFITTATNITATMPEHYRNTWNLSLGADWYATDSITLRTGIGWDETPVVDAYRNLQLPDGNRFLLSLGTHFQATKTVGLDFSWQHVFLADTINVNPPAQTIGAQTVNVNGKVKGGADVFGTQVVWDIT